MTTPAPGTATSPTNPEFPLVIRGGIEIDTPRDDTRKDIMALLALGLRLENVGMFLGAGASREAGGKVMTQIWASLQSTAPKTIDWLNQEGILAANADPKSPVNVENLASKLDLRIEVYRDTKDEKLADALAHCAALQREIGFSAVLDSELWKSKPDATNLGFSKLKNHSSLLARLLGSRQPGQNAPWIFTSNYDLAIEWAAENLGIHLVNGFSGTHLRRFDPSCFDLGLMNLQARGEARFGVYNLFLAKLHGSLSWRQQGDDLLERPSRDAWPEIEEFLRGKKEICPATLILPNTAKYVDTTGFVYGEMLRRFSEFMSRRSTLLIVCGYGFGDHHVNRLLLSGLRNPTLQMIIYLPELTSVSEMPNPVVASLNDLKTKQVILVGGGMNASFANLVDDLPDPGHLDASAEEARKLAQAIESLTATSRALGN